MSRKIYEKAIYGRDKQMQRKVYQRTNNVLPTDAGDYEITSFAVVDGGSLFRTGKVLSLPIANRTTTAGTITVSTIDEDGAILTGALTTAGTYTRDMSGTEIELNKGINGKISVVSSLIYGIDSATIHVAGTGYTAGDVLTVNVEGKTITAGTITVSTVDETGVITAITVTTAGEYTSDISGNILVTGGTGEDASIAIVAESLAIYKITDATINTAGTGFEANDAFDIEVADATTSAGTITVSTVGSNGEITAITVSDDGEYDADISDDYDISTGSGAIVSVEMSLIEA